MLEAELFAYGSADLGCGIRRNQAKASGGGIGHSGGDLLPPLESIGSRICDISATDYSRALARMYERGLKGYAAIGYLIEPETFPARS
jgi:hypothetical protein